MPRRIDIEDEWEDDEEEFESDDFNKARITFERHKRDYTNKHGLKNLSGSRNRSRLCRLTKP